MLVHPRPAAIFQTPGRLLNWFGRRRSTAEAKSPPVEEPTKPTLDVVLDQTLVEVQRINGHLVRERERADRMASRFDVLPDHVATLPEIGRESTRMLGLLRDQAERTTECVQTLQSTHVESQVISKQQTEMLGALHVAIERTADATVDTREALDSLQSASSQLSSTTERLARALQKASDGARCREKRMNEALERTHRLTVRAIYVCGGVATLALVGVLLIALL